MTWEIAVGIIALFEFVLLIINRTTDSKKPINELNISVTELKGSIDALNNNLGRHDKRLDAHSERLNDHERRITVLEEHGKE